MSKSSSGTFEDVLSKIRAESQNTTELGNHFERLIVEFFKKDKKYEWMKDVRIWPKSDDLGIDIIAYDGFSQPWAIQCKCIADDDKLDYHGNVTNLWVQADAENIENKIIVTTGRPTANLRKQCEKTGVYIITHSDLAASTIVWDVNPARVRRGRVHKLREHQKEALTDCMNGFKTSKRGQLIMACGTGKTLTALHVAEKTAGAGGRVLYLVPSISLIKQTYGEWQENSNVRQRTIIVCSDKTAGSGEDMSVTDLQGVVTTDAGRLRMHFDVMRGDKNSMHVVFSTYQSADVVSQAFKDNGFDLIIFDEAHRTAGREGKAFALAHSDDNIRADKRLYMTATPRVYRTDEGVGGNAISMSDEDIFGPQFHRLGFGKAITQGILSDYQAVAFEIVLEDEDRKNIEKSSDGEFELEAECKMSSVYEAIKRRARDGEFDLLNRVLVFHNSISQSKRFVSMFRKVVDHVNERGDDPEAADVAVDVKHVDGRDKARDRSETLDWLKRGGGNNVHVLSNVRCLSEGVDVPTLNGVVFYEPRQSVIDIVQAVGRVMRKKTDGRNMGCVIVPIVVSRDEAMQTTLDRSGSNKLIIQIIDALRAHDDRIDRFLNQLSLVPPTPTDDGNVPHATIDIPIPPQIRRIFDSLPPRLLDTGFYWEEYGQKLGEKAKVVALQAANRSDRKHKQVIDKLHDNLKVVVGDTVTRKDAIDAVAQHIVLQPVFHELFGESTNPVAVAFDNVVDRLDFHTELEGLAEWHELMKYHIRGIDNPRAKQTLIAKIYGSFFETFDKDLAKTIVYTPVELVDFIINSVQHVLRTEFNTGFGERGVRVIDPFCGTGIFIARLMESGHMEGHDLSQTYRHNMELSELQLLAYYTACTNLETTYTRMTNRQTPFRNGCLADTFTVQPNYRQLKAERRAHVQTSFSDPNFERVNRVRDRQQGAHIHVIMTNPPWSAGRKTAGEGRQNTEHPEIAARIKDTYIKQAPKGNVVGLYNLYIRAIRWASDRIGESGVMGFVMPSAWLRGNAEAGIRACLEEEFTDVWCFDLRGNANLQGEAWRKEGEKIFGGGSREAVVVAILVKNPKKRTHKIHYHDIGDYLTREQKLEIVRKSNSVENVRFKTIKPDRYNDWLNQRGKTAEEWGRLVPIGSKEAKRGRGDSIFRMYSRGIVSGRDTWVYNSSTDILQKQMKKYISDCNSQDLDDPTSEQTLGKEVYGELKKLQKAGKKPILDESKIRIALFRPFFKQFLYFDPVFITAKYRIPSFYPHSSTENLTMILPDKAGKVSALMTDRTPDLNSIAPNQCFPLQTHGGGGDLQSSYRTRSRAGSPSSSRTGHQTCTCWRPARSSHSKPRKKGEESDYHNTGQDKGGLFCVHCQPDAGSRSNTPRTGVPTEGGGMMQDNITDWALGLYRATYKDKSITKEDIFYYTYGVLHSPGFRSKYQAFLVRGIPNIPMAPDFRSFERAGRALAQLHLNFETGPRYDLGSPVNRIPDAPRRVAFGRKKRDGPGPKTTDDASRLELDGVVVYDNLPNTTYKVNGRTPVGWFVNRYGFSADKKGKTGNNNYPLEGKSGEEVRAIIERLVYVGTESDRIISGLPEKFEGMEPAVTDRPPSQTRGTQTRLG